MKKNYLSEFVRKNMAWVILLVIVIIFTCLSPNFLSLTNILNILAQNAYVVVVAIGISILMMSGSMDIAVGYLMSLCGVCAGLLLVKAGMPTFPAILLTLLLGVGLSMLTTLIAKLLRISRFMVSVGTMTIFQGLSFVVSGSVSIKGFPDSFKLLGQGYFFGIPFPIILMFILLIIMSFLMNKTYFGSYVYALGGNEEAARLAGIHVHLMEMIISALAGGFVALAALMLVSRLGSAHSLTGPGTEFTVITGILLGGVSIRGGEGKLSGVFAGILIVAILANGMQLAGLDTYYQFIAKGVIMLAAIGFDVYQLSRRQRVKLNPDSPKTNG